MSPTVAPSSSAATSAAPEPAASVPAPRHKTAIAVLCLALAAGALLFTLWTQRPTRLLPGSPIVRTSRAFGTVWIGEDGVLRSRTIDGDSVLTSRFPAGDTAPTRDVRRFGGSPFEREMFERARQNDLLSISGDRAALYFGALLRTYRLEGVRASPQDSTRVPRPASIVLFDAGYVALATESEDTSGGAGGEFDVTLTLLDSRLRQVGVRRVRADAVNWPAALRSHGPFVSLVTRRGDSTMIEVIDAKQPRTPHSVRMRSDVDATLPAVDISAGGVVAVGSGKGSIALFDLADRKAVPDRIQVRGPVSEVLFASRDVLLADLGVLGADVVQLPVTLTSTPEPLALQPEELSKGKIGDAGFRLAEARWPFVAVWRSSGALETYSLSHGKVTTTLGKALIGAAVMLVLAAIVIVTPDPASEKAPVETTRPIPPDAERPPPRSILPDGPPVDEEASGPLLPTRPPPEPPQALVDALARNECILFAGAGLSAQAGLPTLLPFLQQLVEFAQRERLVSEDTAPALFRALQAGNYEAVADELTDTIPSDALARFVHQQFSGATPTALHRRLAQLPFGAVLTTNFDTLLEEAFVGRAPSVHVPSDTEPLLSAVRTKAFFVLKLAGGAERPGSLVLHSTQRYREVIGRNLQLREVVHTLLQRNTIFFAGASLPAIRDYLDALDLGTAAVTREHFALIAQSGGLDELEVRQLKRKYGIQVLEFAPTHGYPEVGQFVDDLVRRVRALGRVSAADQPKRLDRLELRDIGPFRELTIQFGPRRTILLGDNGMGKSIILKSIAAALCGREAGDAPITRLLRSGATRGTIELHVGTDVYSVELQRDTEGAVQVRSASLSPLKLGDWLVLGFPPLRAITWKRPAGPVRAAPPQPSVGDLAPILSTDPDTRLNDLKQWLVNLDRRSEGRDADPRARRILTRFFEAVGVLTPDMSVSLKSIDKKTNEIVLSTTGGEIPLELISQGMVSALCWIGVLLERLYEVHDGLNDPESGGALVLVDEIDAHMHPRWQHALLGPLADLFPSVQFIASTHSPLIVAGLEAREILVLHRDAAGATRVEHPDVDPQGLRADQILTSPLFNLESTRDPETVRRLERFTELSAKGADRCTPAELAELQDAAAHLHVRLPEPWEREEAREAFAMLEGALDAKLAAMPPERVQRLMNEARVQLQETITGSRRPE